MGEAPPSWIWHRISGLEGASQLSDHHLCTNVVNFEVNAASPGAGGRHNTLKISSSFILSYDNKSQAPPGNMYFLTTLVKNLKTQIKKKITFRKGIATNP